MESLMEPSTLFLIKFMALNVAFAVFMLCIMQMCKKMYKMIPMFSFLMLGAFIAYAIVVLKMVP